MNAAEALADRLDRLEQALKGDGVESSKEDDGPSLDDQVSDYEDRATRWIKASLPDSKEYEHISALPPEIVAKRAVARVVNEFRESGKEIPLLEALREMEADCAQKYSMVKRALAAKAKPEPVDEEDIDEDDFSLEADKARTRKAVSLLQKQGWK